MSWQATALRTTLPTTADYGKRGARRPILDDSQIVGELESARTRHAAPVDAPVQRIPAVRPSSAGSRKRGLPLGDPSTRGARIRMLHTWQEPAPLATPNPIAVPRRAWILGVTERPKSRLEARQHTVAARQLAGQMARLRGKQVVLGTGIPAVNIAKGVLSAGTRVIDQRPIPKKRHQGSRMFSIAPEAAARIQARSKIVTTSQPVESSSLLDVSLKGTTAAQELIARKAGIATVEPTAEKRPAWLELAFLAGIAVIGWVALTHKAAA